MTYTVTKTYPHSLGLSVCFRQWGAESHCRFIHGYAMAFTLTFAAETLDANNWVQDFGSLKPVKAYLQDVFDHKMLVAQDDPRIDDLTYLSQLGLADVLVVPKIGCEAFALMVYDAVRTLVPMHKGVRLVSVECREHEGNAATYHGGLL